MRAEPDPYSRFVAALKLLLPLTAAGLLASLFLGRPDEEPGNEIVFTTADIDALGSGLQISNPTFTGTTRSNDRFLFTASVVTPDDAPPTKADISALQGQIDFENGTSLEVSANTAVLDMNEQQLTLQGDVEMDTTDGYHVRTEQLDIDLENGLLEGRNEILTEGPVGRIVSGNLKMAPSDTDNSQRKILFGNGVRLKYDPSAEVE